MATIHKGDPADHIGFQRGIPQTGAILAHGIGNDDSIFPREMPPFAVQQPNEAGGYTQAFMLDLSRVPYQTRNEAWAHVHKYYGHLDGEQQALKAMSLMQQHQLPEGQSIGPPRDVAGRVVPEGPPPEFVPGTTPAGDAGVNPHFRRSISAALDHSNPALQALLAPAGHETTKQAAPEYRQPVTAYEAPRAFAGDGGPEAPTVRVDFHIDNFGVPLTCYYHRVDRKPGWLYLITDTRYQGLTRPQIDMLDGGLTVRVDGHPVAYRCQPAGNQQELGHYSSSGLIIESEIPAPRI